MEGFINKFPWAVILLLCATLGLAPYKPPHFLEKLQMLLRGTLVKPVDWLDFFLHGMPWALLVLKAVYTLKGKA